MPRMIFVNLPVTDIPRSTAFYEAVGMTKNPAFSNENAAAMVWSDTIIFMLLAHPFYATFTSKAIADAHRTSAALLCLSQDSRAAVDAITQAALAAGGAETKAPMDMGFMYGRSFADPDGHQFEPMWMDPAAIPAG